MAQPTKEVTSPSQELQKMEHLQSKPFKHPGIDATFSWEHLQAQPDLKMQ